MVYERVRGWTSGRSLPVQNFVKYPPPPSGARCRCGEVAVRRDEKEGRWTSRYTGGRCREMAVSGGSTISEKNFVVYKRKCLMLLTECHALNNI